ncbi:TPA: tail protein X [Enterobacter hormaechei]
MRYLEHITTEGERWDNLAWRYYGDALAYERIIVANPHVAILPVLPSGMRLVIPVISITQISSEVPPWLR